MKDTSIYDLLNNMDNEPHSYSPLDITPGELNAWKKSFTAKRTATSSRKESSADRTAFSAQRSPLLTDILLLSVQKNPLLTGIPLLPAGKNSQRQRPLSAWYWPEVL